MPGANSGTLSRVGQPERHRSGGIVPRIVDATRRRRAETPVVLCIDVEPDRRVFDRADPPPWLGFERFVERLPALRERLAELTGAVAAFTWTVRMDPQVAQTWGTAEWVADAYGQELEALEAQGDELGMHTHVWRWDRESGEWYCDFEDEAWAAHCVDLALDAFERSFARRCQVHRGGDHFLSGAMLARLEARGVRIDLTVEPGQRGDGPTGGERFRGTCPEYRGLSNTPYRSSPARFPAPDPSSRSDPLLVPLLSAAGRRVARSPLPPDSSPRRFIPRLELELLRGAPLVLAFVVRSSAALGPQWDALSTNLEHIARHRGVRFVTASDALERLEPLSSPAAARRVR